MTTNPWIVQASVENQFYLAAAVLDPGPLILVKKYLISQEERHRCGFNVIALSL